MKREQAHCHRHGIVQWCVILLIYTLLTPASLTGQDPRDTEASDLCRKADAIRASAEKLSQVQRIPWVTDVFEGFRLAKVENRPVFLYMITGDALEDC